MYKKIKSRVEAIFTGKMISISSGIQVWTESFGDIQNPACLLISGAMAPARFWIDEFCQQLADAGYFVIRYDHRDIGLSSAVDYIKNPYMLDDLAKDAIAILDAYSIKKAHVIGHSMGGGIAQLLLLDYPTRLLSAVFVSSSVLTNADLNAKEKETFKKVWAVMLKNKPTKNYAESVGGFMQVYNYLHGDIPVDKDIAEKYIKDMYVRSKPKHIEWFEKFSIEVGIVHNHVMAQQNILDRTHELKKVQVPVFAIHGKKDCLSLPRLVQEYCVDLIPHAKIHLVPGMGHMILSRELFEHIKDLVVK